MQEGIVKFSMKQKASDLFFHQMAEKNFLYIHLA